MHVLSSRTLLTPTDPERSRTFYGEQLGLSVYREFGTGPERGTVYFLGGGFLEVSGRAEAPPSPAVRLWWQVGDVTAAHEELRARGVDIGVGGVAEGGAGGGAFHGTVSDSRAWLSQGRG